MKFELKELPYAYNALEPYVDEATMKLHHDKHHKTYTDKFNAALEGQDALLKKTAEQILSDLNSVPEQIRTAVRNHGGGYLNHNLFWEIMTPNAKPEPTGELLESINKTFGSFTAFKEKFSQTATGLFGSGWAWLTLDKGALKIETTPNQDTPLSYGRKPVLGLDVWEHAYYLKYQNKRPEYVENFFKVINWAKVSELYKGK
ncbi:MAG: superoxide dismutase [Candidatus Diapherotrites archaeon]|nr:superoxide dismutase [Candidatus Diapherotrites archaeon]